jgi:hypothetical protein
MLCTYKDNSLLNSIQLGSSYTLLPPPPGQRQYILVLWSTTTALARRKQMNTTNFSLYHHTLHAHTASSSSSSGCTLFYDLNVMSHSKCSTMRIIWFLVSQKSTQFGNWLGFHFQAKGWGVTRSLGCDREELFSLSLSLNQSKPKQ